MRDFAVFVSYIAILRLVARLKRNFDAVFRYFGFFEDVFVPCNTIAGKEFDPLMQLRRGSFRPYLLASDFS